ncbi:MAG: hypothetical protein ABL933_15180, partial [Methyloglobulus sp.]
ATPAMAAASAAAESAAPAATGPATGMCKDGTETTGASKRGACRGHKGVKEWYADKAAPAVTPTAAAPAATGPATGMCKDGTETSGASKRGACRGHKGVKEWYADKAAPAVTPTTAAPAAAESAAPAATGPATGMCKDGTETVGASKRGACRGHKGVKEWYADKVAPAASPAPAAAVPATTATPAPVAKPSPTPVAKTTVPAPAAGSGQVWVNLHSRSKVYHCEGSKFYGKTKEGEYMSESDAQAKGFRASRNKVCN